MVDGQRISCNSALFPQLDPPVGALICPCRMPSGCFLFLSYLSQVVTRNIYTPVNVLPEHGNRTPPKIHKYLRALVVDQQAVLVAADQLMLKCTLFNFFTYSLYCSGFPFKWDSATKLSARDFIYQHEDERGCTGAATNAVAGTPVRPPSRI